MTATTRKAVIYRKFRRAEGDWPAGTLEQLCSMALQTTGPNKIPLMDDWLARRFPCWETPAHYRFSYALEAADESLFGMLCLYSPNEHIAMIREKAKEVAEAEHISLHEALKQVDVSEAEPPTGENYLKGHAYFLLRGDHCFLVQHTSLRASAVEQYFHDLLRRTGLIAQEHTFLLDGVIAMSSDRQLGDIKGVEIGGVMASPMPARPKMPTAPDAPLFSVGEDEHREIARAKSSESVGKQILDLLFGSTRADNIMDIVPDDAELEVDVRFGFKAKKRRVNREALQQIASAARDLPHGQVRAVGKDGKATGEDIRLQTDMPFRLLRPNGALLEAANAREQLLKVYARFVEDDKIKP